MKKKDIKQIEEEIRDIEKSLNFKESIIAGIVSGLIVSLFFTLSDYATSWGVAGFLAFMILVFIVSELFFRREKRKIEKIRDRLNK